MMFTKLLLLSSLMTPSTLCSTTIQHKHEIHLVDKRMDNYIDKDRHGNNLKRSLVVDTSSVTKVFDGDTTTTTASASADTRTFTCNGNLLTHEFVISYASCKWDVSDKVRIDSDSYDPEIIPVRAVYQHPKYNKSDDSNDLVLIHLQYQTTIGNPDPLYFPPVLTPS